MLSNYLSQIHFRYKVIEFANCFINNYDVNMIKDNEQ